MTRKWNKRSAAISKLLFIYNVLSTEQAVNISRPFKDYYHKVILVIMTAVMEFLCKASGNKAKVLPMSPLHPIPASVIAITD